MLVYDVKLPSRIEAYEIFPASIRRNDEVAFVCDCLMPAGIEGIALRHYSFPDRWWAANIFVDLDGAPRRDTPRGYAYDCDITTPHFEAFGALCNIDLKLDVLIRPDGVTHVITDQEDFDRCIAEGHIDGDDRAGAERGLAELLGLIDAGDFVPFLDSVCPLRSVEDAPEVKILPIASTTDVPVVNHWRALRG